MISINHESDIRHVCVADAWGIHCEKSEAEANANLITAAPELLDAVSWCIDQLQGDSGTGDSYWSEFPEYRAALAAYSKATGGAPKGGAS